MRIRIRVNTVCEWERKERSRDGQYLEGKDGGCLLQILGVAFDGSISETSDVFFYGRLRQVFDCEGKILHSDPRLIRNSVVAVLIHLLPFNLQPKLGRRSRIITTVGHTVDGTSRTGYCSGTTGVCPPRDDVGITRDGTSKERPKRRDASSRMWRSDLASRRE